MRFALISFVANLLCHLCLCLLAVVFVSSEGSAITGENDPTFTPVVGSVIREELVMLPDGRFLMLGGRLERFDRNGNIDPSFFCPVSFSNASVAALPDGKILVAGIAVINRSFRRGIWRFFPEGTLDESFVFTAFEAVNALALEPDGQILIGGTQVIGGSLKPVLRRFNADGTADLSFVPIVNGACYGIFVQPDGSILIGGSFTTVEGLSRTNAARLLPDGSVDPTFTADCIGGGVSWIMGEADGKILIGGGFTTVNGSTVRKIVKVHQSGTIDSSFSPDPVISNVMNVAMQTDGKTLVCGIGGANGLYRIDANGGIDPAINRYYNSNIVRPALDGKGRILVFGGRNEGSSIVPVFGRILNDPGISSLAVNVTGEAEWSRSGALPEINQVTFEVISPGGEWSQPMPASRVDGKWVGGGLLPPNGIVRARARPVQSKNVALIEEFLNLGSVAPDIVMSTKTGVAVAAGTAVSIPPVFPGYSRDMQLKIVNRGDGVLRGIVPTLSGQDAADFSVIAMPVENLAPGESTSVYLRFNGSSPGARSTILSIASDDGDTPVYTVGLNATTGNDLSPVFLSADEIAHRASSSFNGSGLTFGTVTLGFAPPAGTVLSVVQSSSIIAPFSDVEEGRIVTANFNGQSYAFLAGYKGGSSSNDMILTLIGEGTVISSYESPWIGSSPLVTRTHDGGLLVGSSLGVTIGNRIVRLKPDGTLDPLFNAPKISYFGPLIVRPDGRVLVSNMCLNRDGSVDSSYQPDPKVVTQLALQTDGKVIVEMKVSDLNTDRLVRRIHPDGSLDTGFSPSLPWSQGITGVEILPGGNLLVSNPYFPLTQLTPSGAIVPSFQTSLLAKTTVAQRDGKILVVVPNSSSAENPTNLKRLNADGSQDTLFAPVTDGLVYTASLQADGKILIGGSFTQVNGQKRSRTARLFPDGTLDAAFRCDADNVVDSILPDEGGAIVIAGYQTSVSGVAGKYVGRIRAAVSDSSLEFAGDQNLRWSRSGSSPELRRVRVESFEQGGSGWQTMGEALRTSDGWEMVSSTFPANASLRMVGELSSGSPANGEMGISIPRGNPTPDLTVKRDGTGIPSLTGTLDFGEVVKGLERRITISLENIGAGKLNDLSISITGPDASDYSVEVNPGQRLEPMESGGVIVRVSPSAAGGRDAVINIASSDPDTPLYSIRLLATGRTDLSPLFNASSDLPFSYEAFETAGLTFGILQLGFAPAPGTVFTVIENKGLSPISGRFPDLVHGGIVSASYVGQTYQFLASYEGGSGNDLTLRLVESGVADLGFPAKPDGTVWSVATQDDGRILIGGEFLNISGIPRMRIARLHTDGTLDQSFNASVNNRIESFAIQKDRKIIISGVFSEVSGVTRRGIARLHPDGSLDMDFNPDAAPWVYRILLLKSGKILIGGGIDSVGGTPVKSLVRLHPDGTLDDTFNCPVDSSNGYGYVYAMAEEPGGSLWVGGAFSRVKGIQRYGLAKINSDGTVDTSFNLATNPVSAIALQPDGKVVVGGSFVGIGLGSNVPSRQRIARFNANGTLDTFNPSADGTVTSLSVQADGKIIMSGSFTTVGGRKRSGVARVFANGTLDASFADCAANSMVYAALSTGRGEVLAAGSFSRASDVAMKGLAKLRDDPGTDSLEIIDSDSVRWARSGSLPEISSLVFETSSDSGRTWTFLGDGVRSAGGWTLDGTPLPNNGYLRAVGLAIVSNRAFGRTHRTLLFGRSPTPIEEWRQNHFNSPLNAGRGGDLEDDDGDGLRNLLEYGFGSDPKTSTSDSEPRWSSTPEGHEIRFTKPTGVTGIIYGSEWSETMRDGEWYPADDLSAGDEIRYRVPARSAESLFFRFKISNP